MDRLLAWNEAYGLDDFDATIALNAAGLELAKGKGAQVDAAQLTRYLGTAYYFKGDYDVAARHYYNAAAALEKSGERAKLAETHNKLGQLYRKTRDLNRALHHYNAASGIFAALGDSIGIATILNESGVVFEYRGDYAEAERRYRASYGIKTRLRDTVGVAYALSNLASLGVQQKSYGPAEAALTEVVRLHKALRDTFSLALAYNELGALYTAAGRATPARLHLDTSNRIAARMGYLDLQAANHELLAKLAEEEGAYEQAYLHYRLRTALRDSILSIAKTKEIEKLNALYETARKEQRIERQRAQIRQQRTAIGGSAVLFLAGAALVWSRYKRIRLRQRAALQESAMRHQQQATRAVIEAEEQERQRIAKDLHDGIGQMMGAARMNLSVLQTGTGAHTADALQKAIGLVDDSCRELRAVSHNMMPTALTHGSLAPAVKTFLDKLGAGLTIGFYAHGFDDAPRPDVAVETVIYRVVQECVNNVVKHAGAARLDVTLLHDEDGISCTVEDDGRGFNAASATPGIGLANIRTRLAYLKGTVEIESAPGEGTMVMIAVPQASLT